MENKRKDPHKEISSCFKNISSPNKGLDLSYQDMERKIKHGEKLFYDRLDLKTNTQRARAALQKGDNKEYDRIKKSMPAITPHAYYPEGRKEDSSHDPTDIFMFDFDHIEDPQCFIDKAKQLMCVIMVYKSLSNKGFHILVKHTPIEEKYFNSCYQDTKKYFEAFLEIEADEACKNVNRLMIINHDPEVYYNPEAIPLDMTGTIWLVNNPFYIFNNNMSIQQLPNFLDEADKNFNWTAGNRHNSQFRLACMCNKAGFSERDVIDECCARHSQEDFDEKEISDIISDVYKRYSSEHGNYDKPQQPNKDKGTKGHKDIVQDNNDDIVDEDEILSTKCPEADDVRDLIPDYFWDYIIPKNRDKNTCFVVLISFLVAVGAIFRKVRCLVRPNEIATCKLFYIVSGPAASGKSCIGRAYEIFRIHADKIESESQEEVQKGKEAYKNWKMCLKKCKEEDCGCGAEPVIPEQIRIKLSLNISSSKLIHQMGHNLDFPSLLYTTELDSNLDMKDNPLSPQLRAGYEGEPISSHTHLHGDVSVNTPSMAILAAGTPAQLVNFLKNKENGLASRFLPSYLPESDYRKLEDEYMMDYDTYMAQKEAFKGRAQTFSQYAMNAELTFELTTKSKQAIDACMEEIEKRYATFGSDELTSFIRRLIKMNVNMAIVLTTFGLYEKGISTGRHAIPDEIIDKVLAWNPYFIEQHIRLLSDLPDTPINKDSNEIKYAHIFSKLPCDFTFAEACNIFSKHVDVSTKTVQRVLKKWVNAGKLNSAQKHYFRTDCSETHTVA